MKSMILLPLFLLKIACGCAAQSIAQDQSIRYQQERMVYLQWDKNKFTPKAGFLSLNPYYWLTWGLFHPSYHKKDLRPLSATGPQTQRLALVSVLNATDNKYRLQSDTIRNTALSEIANQSGLISEADPMWLLYYKGQLSPVINNSPATILKGLSADVSGKLVSEGLYGWYKNELDILKQRIDAAHSTDMDRGQRILTYHRYLMEYRNLSGIWAIRTSSARTTLDMAVQQQKLKMNQVDVPQWSPHADIEIANKVLKHLQ